MNKKVEIKKIPLEGFIEILMQLYNSGVDYVNMIVEKDPHQDSIWINEDASENKEEKKLEVLKNINFEELG